MSLVFFLKEEVVKQKYQVPVDLPDRIWSDNDLDSGDEAIGEIDEEDFRLDRDQARRYRKTCGRRRTAIKIAT